MGFQKKQIPEGVEEKDTLDYKSNVQKCNACR